MDKFVYTGTKTPELQAYLDYDVNVTRDYEESQRLMDSVQPEVLKAYFKAHKDSYFTPEREKVDSRTEHLSPSGRYKLVTSSYETSPGTWSYTGGKVYRVGSDIPIADVQRNYSAFPFLFVEDHAKGDFLVAGENYQGQSVIDLTTGERRDHLSEGTDKGHGFCWGSYTYEPKNQILVVDGCIWACPYEHRFFDFSDPMDGWPEVKTEEGVDYDQRAPTFEDGLLKCYQTTHPKEDEDDGEEEDEENKGKPLPPIAAYTTFRRDGLRFVTVEKWVSDVEKERRIQWEEGQRKYKERIANFKAHDPLYLTYSELVKDPGLKPEDYESTGVIHEGWSPDYPPTMPRESRWCRRLRYGKAGKGYTVDLDWGMTAGPVKLTIFKDGKSLENKFFPHSVEGMREAFAYTRTLAGEPQ
jgi:hypothetical protein